MQGLRFWFPIGLLLVIAQLNIAHSQSINYFGVAFSPYVKNPPFPNWDTYTLEEIKQMLRIALTYHNSISTYSMGVASYNDGKPWDQADSNCLVARAAGQINRDYNAVVLSVSVGIYQNDRDDLMGREIDNAFLAAIDANNYRAGTVWGLTFTNEYVVNGATGDRVLWMLRNNKARAHSLGLRVGPRIHICGEIWNGPNRDILIAIARESDFIMCNLYPPSNSDNAAAAVQSISDQYYSARDGFWQHNPNVEVQIGETGWATQGQSFFNPPHLNTVQHMVNFWNGMKSWANSNRVKVQMFEAFNEPWKTGLEGEKHFGWWYRPDNNRAVYIEKSTGREFT